LGRQLAAAARRDILERSLAKGALIVLVPGRDAAVGFVNAYAPEHLSVCRGRMVEEAVARLSNAGSLFRRPLRARVRATMPPSQPCPADRRPAPLLRRPVDRGLWEVHTGPAHSREGLAAIRDSVESIAQAEGLIAHKRAVEVRFEARP